PIAAVGLQRQDHVHPPVRIRGTALRERVFRRQVERDQVRRAEPQGPLERQGLVDPRVLTLMLTSRPATTAGLDHRFQDLKALAASATHLWAPPEADACVSSQ